MRIGKYEILQEIGRGGFAVVYKARDTELDRVVALKVLHPYWSEDPSFAARFRHEARAAANLRHPNIITVYETGEAGGQLYIAMEYLPGRTLREVLEAEGALSLDKSLPILEQVADALDYAHGRGLIHRDVKPANIIVEETKRGVQTTLMDFGLVKAMEGSAALTSQGTLLGSPEYMAPEQAEPDRAAEVGPASDRYALGIVAYQMLTGRVPFPGNTPATLNAHEHTPVPSPRSFRPDLPEPVADVLLRMLDKSPASRYPTASEFVVALRDVALAETRQRQRGELLHLPPREAKRVRKPPAPLPFWVWAAVGVAVALVVVAAGLIASRAWQGAQPTSTFTPTLLPPTATPMPTATLRPSAAAPTLTRVGTPTPVATRIRPADGMVMVHVSAGSFLMGSSEKDTNAQGDEQPQRLVPLGAFWIDRTEVTNAQYEKCQRAGACESSAYATDSKFNGADQPVVGVNWNDAVAYCRWAGAALPTEAQWEMAARGTDGRIYPWGDQPVTCEYAVMESDQGPGCGKGATWPVGGKPNGASPYGVLDMSGNAYEWTVDWYDGYPGTTFQSDFFGKKYKVLRGGGWHGTESNIKLRAAYRARSAAEFNGDSFGFRCVVAGP
jgi:formylglycine-generating enzyme required for sulfatase activity